MEFRQILPPVLCFPPTILTPWESWPKSRCVKFGVIALTFSYWSLEVQHGTSHQHGKELYEDLKKTIVALHKDGLGYKKIAKTLKLRCSMVTKIKQRFNRTGSTQNRPRHGRPKKMSVRAQHHIQRLCLGNRCTSAASIAAEVEGVGGQTIRRTLHQIGLHGCRPRRKPLLKMMHKKAHKQFAEDKQTKDMDYWNHVLCSDETKINLLGLDGVKRVWRQSGEEYKNKCLAYSKAWWWECHGLGLHECGQHWGATVQWGNHECQHVLWHTEAEHNPLPSETGPQGSIPTW